jgi:serine kinase of HPr protein (carbohydrate metabolism regulator)
MSETVHATAVLAGADGVLIRGESGSGKSALALELIRRGARLVADDRLTLSCCHGRIVATAPRATAGLIELRGRGLLSLPHEESAVIRLIADIVDAEGLERMPEAPQLTATLLGIALPRQPVPTATDRAATLIDAALRALLPQPDNGLAHRESFGKMAALPTPMASS